MGTIMIIFISDGRLGNQIFQYSFLKTICKENEIIICLNMEMFFQTFEFNRHRIWHISNKYIRVFLTNLIVPFILSPLSKANIVSCVKQNKDFNSRSLPDWSETRGLLPFIRYVKADFFQSEIFFNRKVVSGLKIRDLYMVKARQIISGISEDYTKVFIHIRRGDYINEIFMGEIGIDLPILYYEKAINLIKCEIERPYFIILSDDPSYGKCCFKGLEPKIILKNSSEIDFGIMTLCEAGIISNSSYSWWGAYFMNTKKKVISPKYWYGWKQRVESHIGIQPSFSEIIDFTEAS
jgi:hypothetical protein